MFPSLLPVNFSREVRIVLVLPLDLGDFIFLFIWLPLSYVFPAKPAFARSRSCWRDSLMGSGCHQTGALVQLSGLSPAGEGVCVFALSK